VESVAQNLPEVAEEDAIRAQFYAILSGLLASPPDRETLGHLKTLPSDDSEIGAAFGQIAEVASTISVQEAEEEHTALFIGVTHGEIIPFASHYLTGFLCQQPLADLRGDMAKLGIARSDDVAEPEDHIASVLEMMHGLIAGTFSEAADLKTQKHFFDAHLEPWAPRFFEDLEKAEKAVLYRPVGTIGRAFMAIEKEAFAMSD